MKMFSFGKTNAILYIVDDDVTEFGIKTCIYIYILEWKEKQSMHHQFYFKYYIYIYIFNKEQIKRYRTRYIYDAIMIW